MPSRRAAVEWPASEAWFWRQCSEHGASDIGGAAIQYQASNPEARSVRRATAARKLVSVA